MRETKRMVQFDQHWHDRDLTDPFWGHGRAPYGVNVLRR
jgi:hypothetical protein